MLQEERKHLGRIGLGVILLVASIMLARKDKLAGQGFMLLAGGIIAVGVLGYKQAYESNTFACGGEGQTPCLGDGDYSYQSFLGNV